MTEAAVQARHLGAFAGPSYVAPQFQQPKVPAIFTSDTFVPVTVESVVMTVEYVPLRENCTPGYPVTLPSVQVPVSWMYGVPFDVVM